MDRSANSQLLPPSGRWSIVRPVFIQAPDFFVFQLHEGAHVERSAQRPNVGNGHELLLIAGHALHFPAPLSRILAIDAHKRIDRKALVRTVPENFRIRKEILGQAFPILRGNTRPILFRKGRPVEQYSPTPFNRLSDQQQIRVGNDALQ